MNTIDCFKGICLLLMLPVIVGHGMGAGTPSPGPVVPFEDTYSFVGSHLTSNDLSGDGYLIVEVNGEQTRVDLEPVAESDTPTIVTIGENENFHIQLVSDQPDGRFGELWLRPEGTTGILKLSHSLVAEQEGQFFEATYRLRPDDLFSGAIIEGASMSSFILSRFAAGSEAFVAPGTLNIYLNDELLHEGIAGEPNGPLVFDAEVGDRLKVVVTDVGTAGTMDEIWLHKPDGWGTRLTYKVELDADSEFTATYEID